MTTMLDKMAEALYVADCRFANGLGMQDVAFPPWAAVSYSIRARFHDAARAALQAIREPDPKTVEAGCLAAQDGVGCTPWDNVRAWEDGTDGASRQGVRDYVARAQTAMIDEILEEKPE